MSNDTTAATRNIIDTMYGYYLSGDQEGMLSLMSDNAVVTFVGHGTFHGKDAIRAYMAFSGGLLHDLVFNHPPEDRRRGARGRHLGRDRHHLARRARQSTGVDVYHIIDGHRVSPACSGHRRRTSR